MAVGVRGLGGRSNGAGDGGSGVLSVVINFFSYRMLILGTFCLLFVATATFLFSSRISYQIHSGIQTRGNVCSTGNFLALQSGSIKSKLGLVTTQGADHIPLVQVYVAYARKLKLEMSRQRKMLAALVKNYKVALFDADVRVEKNLFGQFKKDAREKIKVAKSMIAKADESYDTQLKIQELKDIIVDLNELLVKAKKNGALTDLIASESIPTSMHCLAVRLMEEGIAQPQYFSGYGPKAEFENPSLYHYVVFSDNVVAVSVVVSSAAKNAKEPWKHVFHIITNRMLVAAMKVWFKIRPIEGGAHIEVKALEDYSFWNMSYVPVLRQSANVQTFDFDYRGRVIKNNNNNLKLGSPEYLSVRSHLLFYLPEMYPKLHKILFLDEDVVVQKDMSELWEIGMDGMVNGAVETCSNQYFRYDQFLNFSNPLIQENFHPDTCAWAFGMNMFNLDAWRHENCTELYHHWQNLNENETLWRLDTLPPGLITFNSLTKSLDKSWHVFGLGQNPVLNMDEVNNAAVIHFSGYMKPWLDYSYNQYKHLWDKYMDSDMPLLQMCNFVL